MEQGSKKDIDEPELRPPAPLPCANGCGFFGSPDTRDLCSKCFRDSLRRAEAQGHPTASALSSAAPPASAEQEHDAAVARESKEPGQGEGTTRRPAEGKSRCAACGRKVGLMGFECRCGGVFCGAHRYSDRHDCGYDYRGTGRDAISQANPVVRPDKVDKLRETEETAISYS